MPRRFAVALCATISTLVFLIGANARQPLISHMGMDLLPIAQRHAAIPPPVVIYPTPTGVSPVPLIAQGPKLVQRSGSAASGATTALPALPAHASTSDGPVVPAPTPTPAEAPPAAATSTQTAALTAEAAPAQTPAPALTLTIPSADGLYLLRLCESSDNYGSISAGGAYRGAYQFGQATWDAVAARWYPELVGADPATVSPEGQDALARALYAEAGSSPWPHCGRYL